MNQPPLGAWARPPLLFAPAAVGRGAAGTLAARAPGPRGVGDRRPESAASAWSPGAKEPPFVCHYINCVSILPLGKMELGQLFALLVKGRERLESRPGLQLAEIQSSSNAAPVLAAAMATAMQH